jgi:tetratricopeptide (TPR) repeat protein
VRGWRRRPRPDRENALRDSDSGEQALRLSILLWSGAGGLIAALLGLFLAQTRGWPLVPAVLGLFALGAGAVYVGAAWIAQGAGEAAASILTPSGSSTPARAGYSLAESLEARGRYDEAIEAYEAHARESPSAAEPCVRLARLYRDRLTGAAGAAAWLRRARDRAVDPAQEQLLTRELVELLANRLGDTAAALPELARLAERHRATPLGAWARAEIRRLKTMRSEEQGQA